MTGSPQVAQSRPISKLGSFSPRRAFFAALILPLCCAASGDIPDSFSPADAHLQLVLTCHAGWVGTYELSGTSLVLREFAARGAAATKEQRFELEPDVAAGIFADVFSSTFLDLPARVGDRTYLPTGSNVERFEIEVSTGCAAEMRLQVGDLYHSVSAANASLMPGGIVETLQRHSRDCSEDGG